MTHFWVPVLTPTLHPAQADVATPKEGGVGGSAEAGAGIRGLRLWQGEVLGFWEGGLWYKQLWHSQSDLPERMGLIRARQKG